MKKRESPVTVSGAKPEIEPSAAPRLRRITFAPLPTSPSCVVREHGMDALPPPLFDRTNGNDRTRARRKAAPHIKSKGFRRDYSIGETLRDPSHVAVEPRPDEVFRAIDSLREHDFAFVKRSDGSYSYAILAFRSLEPSDDRSGSSDQLEEFMAFVVNNAGSLKMIKREQWSKYVRLAFPEGSGDHPVARTRSRRERFRNDERDAWVPPSIISFIPANCNEEDGLSSLLEW